jgi:hypothetical protein
MVGSFVVGGLVKPLEITNSMSWEVEQGQLFKIIFMVK